MCFFWRQWGKKSARSQCAIMEKAWETRAKVDVPSPQEGGHGGKGGELLKEQADLVEKEVQSAPREPYGDGGGKSGQEPELQLCSICSSDTMPARSPPHHSLVQVIAGFLFPPPPKPWRKSRNMGMEPWPLIWILAFPQTPAAHGAGEYPRGWCAHSGRSSLYRLKGTGQSWR